MANYYSMKKEARAKVFAMLAAETHEDDIFLFISKTYGFGKLTLKRFVAEYTLSLERENKRISEVKKFMEEVKNLKPEKKESDKNEGVLRS